ncbi:MAG: DUF2283 domain-containing protein [Anaerolineae bacterium]|nr:DUF2283 domain-containing protein [Anaerolineae bacterium]
MSLEMRYDAEDDVLMIWLARGKTLDHAEHVGSMILHLTEQGEPILLEVLNARDFVADLVRTAMTPAEAAA